MDIAPANQVIEARVEDEDRVIAAVSEGTLAYMFRHGLAHERRLRRHRGDLGHVAEEEHDLFEAMRLAARLRRVDGNIGRAAGRNERLRFEIVRREARGRPGRDEGPRRFPLYSGEGSW